MTRRLIAIRHAKPLSEGYAEDTLRPLSEEGKSIQRAACQSLKDQGIAANLILSSPYLRAMQTSEICKDIFGAKVRAENALGSPFDPDVLIEHLQNMDDGKSLVIVGHAPTLSMFVNNLVGETVLPDGMSKSSTAIVDFDDKPELGKGKFFGYFLPP